MLSLFSELKLDAVFKSIELRMVEVKIGNLSEPVEKFTDWERFQSLALELISPRIEINSGVEADKAARDFTASIAGLSVERKAEAKSILATNQRSSV
jgi:hypothetical protein